jgi:hypothetical protein
METGIKQFRCGSCGEKKHELYIKPTGEILVECCNPKCKNVSMIAVSIPKITVSNYSGDGCIAVF